MPGVWEPQASSLDEPPLVCIPRQTRHQHDSPPQRQVEQRGVLAYALVRLAGQGILSHMPP